MIMAKIQKKKQDEPESSHPEHLSEDEMEAICRKVIDTLETKKLYLKYDFSAWELSRAVGIREGKISQSINRHLGRNFFEVINRMRVEEVKRLIRESAERGIRVHLGDAGAQSGFCSRSTFFDKFNEYEAMTPKQYMKMCLIKDTQDSEYPSLRAKKRSESNEQTETQ